MSTPIEIVRELVTYRGMRFNDKTQSCITTALAAVLRDAERFAALERAHDQKTTSRAISIWEGWRAHHGTLAELADRLKGTK